MDPPKRHHTAGVEMVFVRSLLGGLSVIDDLEPASESNGFRVLLLHVLSNETDVRARVSVHLVRVDRLAIVGLTDFLDIVLQALVGEESARLSSSSRRARKTTCPLGNVRQELINLEWIGLFL